MDSLPSELLIPLLKEVNDIPSIIHLSLASTKYYKLIQNNPLLWKDLFDQFPQDPYYSCSPSNNINNKQTSTTTPKDWKKLLSEKYSLRNNWNRGKAIVSKLPGLMFS